ncbi:tartrate dehydrogenase/decarboxylase / D-malate dehydrogenase [Austwickia chelonae]|uniref:D-malate dehydrogenase (decarboxylating) n=1 Tax=Austwickia chelonae NBRC 105200 TaxID=1184607 RepID=K6UNY6_9MICO|nr:tartrate dehydrogenase [Austwickia chelonae]GAB79361.1 putative tartrate dehydrogenase [Austwickia chelonae NBRC 105200]SEW43896.1 tartrate dehydrogenase/decarboxylase / D-malate dehydrogenase [Austwickia chelonae]
MRIHRIALIPGDGIGREVLPAAWAVLTAAGARHGFSMAGEEFDWGCERHAATGAMMPADGIARLRHADSILLGAVGYPRVPDHVSLWGLLIPLRREFDQYVNLRPIRVFEGAPGPLREAVGTDLVVVRENVEGEYSDVGGRSYVGTPWEQASQQSLFTRRGVERVARYALDLAEQRRGRLTSATKSNGIIHTMPFWDEVVADLVAQRRLAGQEVDFGSEHIDALAAKIVLRPKEYDVIVASNLFGDILSDLAAAVAGSIGIAPAGNINPEREFPSMFEPVHGSAPDIAGQAVANPLGAIWAGVMMLEHLGEAEAAAEIFSAMTAVINHSRCLTPDLGGSANTREVVDAVIERLSAG